MSLVLVDVGLVRHLRVVVVVVLRATRREEKVAGCMKLLTCEIRKLVQVLVNRRE